MNIKNPTDNKLSDPESLIPFFQKVAYSSHISLDKILAAYLALGSDFLSLFSLLEKETLSFLPLPKSNPEIYETVDITGFSSLESSNKVQVPLSLIRPHSEIYYGDFLYQVVVPPFHIADRTFISLKAL